MSFIAREARLLGRSTVTFSLSLSLYIYICKQSKTLVSSTAYNRVSLYIIYLKTKTFLEKIKCDEGFMLDHDVL